MADRVVGHHPTMPSIGETVKAVHSTRRLEDSLHAFIMTILLCVCKVITGVIATPCKFFKAWHTEVGFESPVKRIYKYIQGTDCTETTGKSVMGHL